MLSEYNEGKQVDNIFIYYLKLQRNVCFKIQQREKQFYISDMNVARLHNTNNVDNVCGNDINNDFSKTHMIKQHKRAFCLHSTFVGT